MSDPSLIDVFTDDNYNELVEYIINGIKKTYDDDEITEYFDVVFIYGMIPDNIDGVVLYIRNCDRTKGYFEKLGYEAAMTLPDDFMPFLVFYSTEASISVTTDEGEATTEKAIVILSLAVDGRKRLAYLFFNKENSIKIKREETFDTGDVSILEGFYDGIREYLISQKDLDKEE